MPIPVLMPALSPTMTEGKLAKWHVKVGDAVKAGQVICEIETDKATMEVEAVDEGTVAQILIEEGVEGVKVNTPILHPRRRRRKRRRCGQGAAGRRGTRRPRRQRPKHRLQAKAALPPQHAAARRHQPRPPPSRNGPARRRT